MASRYPPLEGQTVAYTLDLVDAAQIIKQRRYNPSFVGSPPSAGDVFPLLIVYTGSPDEGVELATGQLILDGNDTLWVQQRQRGPGHREWLPWPEAQ
ncbi:MAG: hypothetical protein ACRDYC_05605 [Acidimicrobiales bacterium]